MSAFFIDLKPILRRRRLVEFYEAVRALLPLLRHFADLGGMPGGDVGGLRSVAVQIVQLPRITFRGDEFPRAVAKRPIPFVSPTLSSSLTEAEKSAVRSELRG